MQATRQSYHGKERIRSTFCNFLKAFITTTNHMDFQSKSKSKPFEGCYAVAGGRGIFWQVATLFSCFPKWKRSIAGSCFLPRRIAGGATGRWVFGFKSWVRRFHQNTKCLSDMCSLLTGATLHFQVSMLQTWWTAAHGKLEKKKRKELNWASCQKVCLVNGGKS